MPQASPAHNCAGVFSATLLFTHVLCFTMHIAHFSYTIARRTLARLILSTAAVVALGACGRKDDVTDTPPATQPQAAAQQALKVGFVYVSPVGDGGWTYQHELARKVVQEKFGSRVQTSFTESVSEGPDVERVIRDMTAQGNTLIFATSFGYQEYIQRLARELPNVQFQHATGYKTAPNVTVYDGKTYEGAYLAGIVAGAMSKSRIIGVVASVPIPEVVRNINAFVLGAQSVDPAVRARVVWVNEWFSPPKEAEAAASLINGGVDVLYQNTNSPAVLKTAEERGVYAFGKDGDMSAHAPRAHLGSAILDWAPYYTDVVQRALDGTLQGGGSYWWGVKEGTMRLEKISESVPRHIHERVQAVQTGLRDGSFQIWRGPIHDNNGQEVLANGVVADEAFLRGIKFYVRGIEGSVPGTEK